MARPETKPSVTVYVTLDELAQIDAERAAHEAANPGSRMSRASWAGARLREALAKRSKAAQKRKEAS